MSKIKSARFELRNISDLTNWENNPRSVLEEDMERLKGQISKLGVYKTLLVNQDNTVLGGNMRLRAFQMLGVEEVMCGIVATKNPGEMLEYALSDNDQAGTTDEQKLAELATLYPIQQEMYKVQVAPLVNLESLLDKFRPEPEEDEVPEVSEGEPVSKLGEVYQLGRHRLMCGDSTDKVQVELLMNGAKADMVFTDPPYGVDVVPDSGFIGGGSTLAKATKFRKVLNDDKELDVSFLLDNAPRVIIWGGNYFCHYLPRGTQWLVWDKDQTIEEERNLSFGGCELAWTNLPGKSVKRYRNRWVGFSQPGESGQRAHPNQKPLKMLGHILEDFTEKYQTIQDLFGGSGSTLIACEQLDRTCYMMELDEKYVDVIRKRYWKLTHDGNEEGWQDGE